MKTGFIGLGAMGCHMARHLLGAGHLIGVWNRTRETTQAWWVDAGSRWGDACRQSGHAGCTL